MSWLCDAHAMEMQAIQMLQNQARRIESYPDLRSRIVEHLAETQAQAAPPERCIERHGTTSSPLNHSAAAFLGNMQALSGLFFGDEVVKGALASYTFEHLSRRRGGAVLRSTTSLPRSQRCAAWSISSGIGEGGPRRAINLTDLETGAPVVVDSAATRLRPEHVVASMALPPDFPPIEIDGRWFCDGGFSANLPPHAVLDQPAEQDPVCIAVDLPGDPGPPLFSVDGMIERANDLLFANQTRATLATFEARHAGRSDGGSVVLLLLACNGQGERISQTIWDYGRRSLDQRWQAGYMAGADLIERLQEMEPAARPGLEVRRHVVPSALVS